MASSKRKTTSTSTSSPSTPSPSTPSPSPSPSQRPWLQLVLIAVVVVLISILVPSFLSSFHSNNQTPIASNLENQNQNQNPIQNDQTNNQGFDDGDNDSWDALTKDLLAASSFATKSVSSTPIQEKSNQQPNRNQKQNQNRDVEKKLLIAVADGDLKQVKSALAKGADPNCQGLEEMMMLPPLHLACYIGSSKHVQVVAHLLSVGASPSAPAKSAGVVAPALFYALGLNGQRFQSKSINRMRIVAMLLRPNNTTNSPSSSTVSTLADPNERSVVPVYRVMHHYRALSGMSSEEIGSLTPLHFAVLVNNLAGTVALLDAGARSNAPSLGVFRGFTPLHLAALGGGELNNLRIVMELLNRGARLDLTNEAGNTPLHLAAMKASSETVYVMLMSLLVLNNTHRMTVQTVDENSGGESNKIDEDDEEEELVMRRVTLKRRAEAIVSVLRDTTADGRTVLDLVRLPPLFKELDTILIHFIALAQHLLLPQLESFDTPNNNNNNNNNNENNNNDNENNENRDGRDVGATEPPRFPTVADLEHFVTALPSSPELSITQALRDSWEQAPRGGWGWKNWTSLDQNECDIERKSVHSLTYDDYMKDYYSLGRPIILSGNFTHSWKGWQRWTKPEFVKRYGSLNLTAGPVPYGKLYKREQVDIPLGSFVDSLESAAVASEPENQTNEEEKEPWIVFEKDMEKKHPQFMNDFSTPSWFAKYGQLEPQLSVGGFRSGAPWHHHTNAWCAVLYGRKRWLVVPPSLQLRLHSSYRPWWLLVPWYNTAHHNTTAQQQQQQHHHQNLSLKMDRAPISHFLASRARWNAILSSQKSSSPVKPPPVVRQSGSKPPSAAPRAGSEWKDLMRTAAKWESDLALKEGLYNSKTQSATWLSTRFDSVIAKGAEMFGCTQGPGEVMVVPKMWAHLTVNMCETVNLAREFFNEPYFELEMMPFTNYRVAIDEGNQQ